MKASQIVSQFIICLALVGVVFMIYQPVLRADFLHWDDPAHITENEFVYAPVDQGGLRQIFSHKTAGQYIPLTVLSFAIDYRIGGDSPTTYHFTNLLIHSINALLVFLLAYRLGLHPIAAFLSALMFAVHPIRVESVAWISQRKQLLYAVFFLASMILYEIRLRYVLRQQNGPKGLLCFLGAHIAGVASILSNPMAVGLPGAFLVMDWFRRRPISSKVFLEKLPLMMIMFFVAGLTLYEVAPKTVVHPFQAIAIACWTFVFYLRQYLFAWEFIPIVRMPVPVSLGIIEYALSAGFCLILAISLIRLRKIRWLVLAFGFFTFSLLLLIFFGSVKAISLAADRFVYLPGVAMTLLLAYAAQKLLAIGRPISATVVFRRVVTSALLIFMLLIQSLGTYRQAYVWQNDIALWRHQLMFEPYEPIALNGLAVALREKKEFQQAEDHYRQMVSVAAQGYELNLNEEAQQNVERVSYIIDLMRLAKQGAPELAEIPYRLGQYYQDLGLYTDAVDEYRQAVELDESFKDVYLDLGRIYLDLKDLDRAGLAFQQFYRLKPVQESHFLEIVGLYAEYLDGDAGNIALRSGMMEVIGDFVKFANNGDLNAEVYLSLGQMYVRAGENSLAKDAFKRALEINSRYSPAHYALGVLYMGVGENVRAKEYFESAVSIDPKHVESLVKLGNINYSAGNVKAAREHYEQAISANPRHAQAHFNLGYTFEESGQLQKAIAKYHLALRHDPKNAEAYFNLGNVYVKQDDLVNAMRQYESAVKYNPDHIDAWVNMAVTSHNSGNRTKAQDSLEQAVLLGFEPPADMVSQLGRMP